MTDTSTWTTLLAGVVGSHAYGLARPDSDEDRLQFAAAPTSAFHGLDMPVDKHASQVMTDPDITVHEIGKAVSLLLKCNPTITELLWMTRYEKVHPMGWRLVGMRSQFLSSSYVRNAYLGYATAQYGKVRNAGPNSRIRGEKNARHLLRLLDQGVQLYTTGELTVKVVDPDRYFAFGRKAVADPTIMMSELTRAEQVFATAETPLPLRPDREAADEYLRDVRAYFFFIEERNGK